MINYTPCQEKAKEELEYFLADPHQDKIILSSPAGCGKSFLVQSLLGNLEDVNSFRKILDTSPIEKVEMAAMSNKAAQVINGSTFDSLYGLFPRPDFKTGKTFRQRKGGSGKTQRDAVIVIDEAGMLDSDGLRHLNDLTHRSKVILTLDRYQLPPVGEPEAPIFDLGIPVIEMSTPVRQAAGSPLLELCDSLRDGVKSQVQMPIFESNQVQYVTDEQAIDFFTHITPNDKVLTYTNDLAVRLNQVVRSYKGIDGFWKEGEILVSNGILKSNGTIQVSNEQKMEVLAVGDECTNEWGMQCHYVMTDKGSFMVPIEHSSVKSLLDKSKRAKDWHTYYGIKESVPDFRGAWSSTVHKSQGSTYNDVFINLNNLKKAKFQDFNLFLRLLYVAISRTKGKVLLYGNL